MNLTRLSKQTSKMSQCSRRYINRVDDSENVPSRRSIIIYDQLLFITFFGLFGSYLIIGGMNFELH
jgi:hypothetical protein